MSPPTSLTRRDALRLGAFAAVGASLTACTTSSNGAKPTATTTASPGSPEDPDRALRAEVAASEQQISELYSDAAAHLSASLARRVTTLGARHSSYRAAIDPTASHASGSGSAQPTVSTSSGTNPRPADVVFTLRRLRTAETTASAARAAQSVRAIDAELARVIVLAGAGAAGAAEVLRRLTP